MGVFQKIFNFHPLSKNLDRRTGPSCYSSIFPLFAQTTISFHVSNKSCLQVLPGHFPYQANHACKYYHGVSRIKQIMCECTTISFQISSKSCVNLRFYVGMLFCIQVKGSIFRFRAQGSKFLFLFITISL